MNRALQNLRAWLPDWVNEWLDTIVPVAGGGADPDRRLAALPFARRLIERVTTNYALPEDVALITRRTVGFLLYGGALLWGLERLGVSGTVLWGAFTGFAAVGAVAFFAAWSVLSNIFCALLIFTTRMFWPGDTVEVLENGEKPGLKGRVMDINLVYTTLQESGNAQEGTTLKIPNSMFFQRAVRRWHGAAPELPRTQDLVSHRPDPHPPAPARSAIPAKVMHG